MKHPRTAVRFPVLAAGAAMVLLLSSCGSDDAGSAAPPAAAPTAATSEVPAETPSEAPAETAADEVHPSSADVPEERPTLTVGGDATALDDQSKMWVATFCGGISPMMDMMTVDANDPDSLATYLKSAGTALSDTATKLEVLPAPTFEGGDRLADVSVGGLRTLGTQFLAAGDAAATGDMAAVEEAMSAVGDNEALQAFEEITPTDEIQEAMKALPECAALDLN